MSVSPLPERRLMHEIAGNGQERHYMRKVDGVWTCECGATADRFGNVLPERLGPR